MKEKSMVFSTVMLLLLLSTCLVAVVEAGGPNTASMLVHLGATENDLQTCSIDIYGNPIGWSPNPNIQYKDYVELGMHEIDMNNQKWPTGCPIHKFYDKLCPRCRSAMNFRKAIACMVDWDRILVEVLDGCGYRLYVPYPPPQSAYTDIPWYRSLGLIYDYNLSRADEFLLAAGFNDTDGDGIRNDPFTGANMDPLKFYIRMDDPVKMRIGLMLRDELWTMGIPVQDFIAEWTICYQNVMVHYNYHLYTGSWILSTIPDQYFDLYSSYTYHSYNYPGFCNHVFDDLAEQLKYPTTVEDARLAAIQCGAVFLQYCPVVPLFSRQCVKGYKTGWKGVVNNLFYGIDNWYSFFTMYRLNDGIIDYGVKDGISRLNVITSGSMPPLHVIEAWEDPKILELIYDSMIRENPFNGAPTEFFLATDYVGTTWDASKVGGDPDATHMVWTIRNGVLWHDGSAFTRDDVKFTIDFMKVCGNVSWNYPLVRDVYNVTLGPGADQITVRMRHKSAWSYQWIGSLPIIKKSIWELITDEQGHYWWEPEWDPTCVKSYKPASSDIDEDGISDLVEDGTSAWAYNLFQSVKGISLGAWTNFYFTPIDIVYRLKDMFHYGAGDVDENGEITIIDIALITYAFGTSGDPYWPPLEPPIPWDVYNSACDLDRDGDVDIDDLGTAGRNYGNVMG